MSRRGRFGKYGEVKRLERIRRSGSKSLLPKGWHTKTWLHGLMPGRAPRAKGRIRIRPARSSDEEFIKELSAKVFSAYGPYGEIISQWFKSVMPTTLVALMEGERVGFVMTGLLSSDRFAEVVCELLAIAVKPEKQRHGIGKMLLKEAEKKAARLGEKKIFLQTAVGNTAAQKLFSNSGYYCEAIKKNFYPSGQDALMMSKSLKPAPQGS